MVERLRQAIEKARHERESGDSAAAHPPEVAKPADSAIRRRGEDAAWEALPLAEIAADALRHSRIVTDGKSDSAHIQFDILRTRLLKICREKDWRRIGITSATVGCGKTFVTLNLAFSLARNAALRCVVVDADLRRPGIARALNLSAPPPVSAFLTGAAAMEAVARRVRPNLALLCGTPTPHSAELIQNPHTAVALDALQRALEPDVMLIDLPPVFVGDDVLSLAGLLDAVILVASAGHSTARDIEEAERIIGDSTALLGVVLNKVEVADVEAYEYASDN